MLKTVAALFLAINCSAAIITVDLHPFGPAYFNFLINGSGTSSGIPSANTFQMTDTPISLDLTLNGTAITAAFGQAVATTNPQPTDVTIVTVPFVFDVAKSTPITTAPLDEIFVSNGMGTFYWGCCRLSPVYLPYIDFGDGTSLAISLNLDAIHNSFPLAPSVNMPASFEYFPTAQGAPLSRIVPIPEPGTLILLLLGCLYLTATACIAPTAVQTPPISRSIT